MPKKNIDYSKTKMYKIVCNDPKVKHIYVGSTTKFTTRKSQHKSNCNNPNLKAYNFKIYKAIRENGGWDNWSMLFIENFPCENGDESRARERELLEELQANLNVVKPTRTKKEYRDDNKEKFKQYRDDHKEEMKQYRDDHKEEMKQYRKEKFKCECGGKYTNSDKSTHNKTKKHQDYLTNL